MWENYAFLKNNYSKYRIHLDFENLKILNTSKIYRTITKSFHYQSNTLFSDLQSTKMLCTDFCATLQVSHRASEPWPLINSDDIVPKCSRVFGNGFSKRFDLCTARGTAATVVNPGEPIDADGSPACFYSEFGKTAFCSIPNLSIDPRKVHVSKGGEAIDGEWVSLYS